MRLRRFASNVLLIGGVIALSSIHTVHDAASLDGILRVVIGSAAFLGGLELSE